MKILVFDDKPSNLAAAQAQLKEHEVTVVGTYDQAYEAILPVTTWDNFHKIKKERFNGEFPTLADEEAVREECTTYPNFDVFLTDLMVPASSKSLGTEERIEFTGQEMPLGIFLALAAAAKGRIPHIGVLTSKNHHTHPASAAIDMFNYNHREELPGLIKIAESNVFLCNGGCYMDSFLAEDLSKSLPYKEREKIDRDKMLWLKHWARFLRYILTGEVKE